MDQIRHPMSSPYFYRRLLVSLNAMATGVALARWFFTKPDDSARRYLELVWACVPIANIVYAWDWLKTIFFFLSHIRVHFG